MPELWDRAEWIVLPTGGAIHRDDLEVCRKCGAPRMTIIEYVLRDHSPGESVVPNVAVACRICTKHWRRTGRAGQPLWREVGEVDMRTGTVYQTEEQRHASQVRVGLARLAGGDRDGEAEAPEGDGRDRGDLPVDLPPAVPERVAGVGDRDKRRGPAGCHVVSFPGGGRGFICRR